MGWSAFKYATSPEDLSEGSEVSVVQLESDPDKEVNAQVAQGLALAKQIIESGAIGKGEGYHVHLSGHANAGHTADSMHAAAQHDSLSVSVSVAAYPGHAKRAEEAAKEEKRAEIERQRTEALAGLES